MPNAPPQANPFLLIGLCTLEVDVDRNYRVFSRLRTLEGNLPGVHSPPVFVGVAFHTTTHLHFSTR
jgi:hypothetical protein